MLIKACSLQVLRSFLCGIRWWRILWYRIYNRELLQWQMSTFEKQAKSVSFPSMQVRFGFDRISFVATPFFNKLGLSTMCLRKTLKNNMTTIWLCWTPRYLHSEFFFLIQLLPFNFRGGDYDRGVIQNSIPPENITTIKTDPVNTTVAADNTPDDKDDASNEHIPLREGVRRTFHHGLERVRLWMPWNTLLKSTPSNEVVSTVQDVYIVYGTTPNFATVRDPNRGSWFVQAFVNIFYNNYETLDFDSLMRRVQYRLKKMGEAHNVKIRQTIAYEQRGVTKKFYISPASFKLNYYFTKYFIMYISSTLLILALYFYQSYTNQKDSSVIVVLYDLLSSI